MEMGEPVAAPHPAPRAEKKDRNIPVPTNPASGQAGTFVQAAQQGAPFCELCAEREERLRRESEARSDDVLEPAASSAQENECEYDDRYQLIDEATGEPLVNFPYRLETESGIVVEGSTDGNGFTQKISSRIQEHVYLKKIGGERC